MKIVYIANARIPTEKAHGIQIVKMCEAFASSGSDVILVFPKRENPIGADLFKYYGVQKNFRTKELYSPNLVFFGRIGFLIQTMAFSIMTLAFLIREKPEVIYSRDETPLFVAYMFFWRRAKIFWEVHISRANILAKFLVRKITGAVFISKGLYDHYEETGLKPRLSIVAHDGVDLKMFFDLPGKRQCRVENGLPVSGKIVLYAGKIRTMGQKKGVEDLMNAFGRLPRKNDTFLVIVGLHKEEEPYVRAEISSLGIESEKLILVPHVHPVRIPYYLSAADVLIMNYPKTEHYARFMSPLKLFEYMASGTPMITTDLPSLREVLEDGEAVFVPPGNLDELKDKILAVLEKPENFFSVAEKAKIKAETFNWDNRAKFIMNFILNANRG